jgi:hypothetical protein
VSRAWLRGQAITVIPRYPGYKTLTSVSPCAKDRGAVELPVTEEMGDEGVLGSYRGERSGLGLERGENSWHARCDDKTWVWHTAEE